MGSNCRSGLWTFRLTEIVTGRTKNAGKDLEELTIYFISIRAIIREVKSRKKNLAIAWIGYKKAYDMVPHSWIKECLDLFGVAENIKTLLVNIMGKRRVMLCAGKSELEEVDIKRDIFQGEYLSPFVFVLAFDPIKFDFKKNQGNIRVFRKQR